MIQMMSVVLLYKVLMMRDPRTFVVRRGDELSKQEVEDFVKDK